MGIIPHFILSPSNASVQKDTHRVHQSQHPSMTSEAIISLAFGLIMFLVALLALLQGYKHHQELWKIFRRTQKDSTPQCTVDVVELERCTIKVASRQIHRSYVTQRMQKSLDLTISSPSNALVETPFLATRQAHSEDEDGMRVDY